MSKAGDALADRILSELSELSALTDRVRRAWEMVVSRNDDFYLDSVALNLHGFYSGLEGGGRGTLMHPLRGEMRRCRSAGWGTSWGQVYVGLLDSVTEYVQRSRRWFLR